MVCFKLSNPRFQNLLGIIALVPEVGVNVSWGLFHRWKKWCISCGKVWCHSVACENLVYVFVPIWWILFTQFHEGWFKVLVKDFWIPIVLRVVRCREIWSIPSCWSTWSMRSFLNSMPLSNSMYLGHIWTGSYWLMNVDTMVSADLSGMGKASCHPVRWSIMVRMCLLSEWKFHTLWPSPWQSCQRGILEFLSSVEGKLELLLFLCSKVHIEQCMLWYPCSCLSNSTNI